MPSVNTELVDAVRRLRQAEQEVHDTRIEVAVLLSKAARTQPVTSLSRLTNINRTTIYWLIATWSNSNGSTITD